MSHISISEVTALELFALQELLKIIPENVLDVNVVMSLMSLQLKSECVPLKNLRWNLAAGKADVVASDTGEKLSLLLIVLPIFELPVLSIDKYGDNALPTGLCEVGDTIVNIECYGFVAEASCNLNNLLALLVHDHIFTSQCFVLIIDAFLEEALHVGQSQVSWD